MEEKQTLTLTQEEIELREHKTLLTEQEASKLTGLKVVTLPQFLKIDFAKLKKEMANRSGK